MPARVASASPAATRPPRSAPRRFPIRATLHAFTAPAACRIRPREASTAEPLCDASARPHAHRCGWPTVSRSIAVGRPSSERTWQPPHRIATDPQLDRSWRPDALEPRSTCRGLCRRLDPCVVDASPPWPTPRATGWSEPTLPTSYSPTRSQGPGRRAHVP